MCYVDYREVGVDSQNNALDRGDVRVGRAEVREDREDLPRHAGALGEAGDARRPENGDEEEDRGEDDGELEEELFHAAADSIGALGSAKEAASLAPDLKKDGDDQQDGDKNLRYAQVGLHDYSPFTLRTSKLRLFLLHCSQSLLKELCDQTWIGSSPGQPHHPAHQEANGRLLAAQVVLDRLRIVG